MRVTKRLAWFMVVLTWSAACGPSRTPVTPSTTSVPATSTPIFSGDYVITLASDPACDNLPEALRTRTYLARAPLRAALRFSFALGDNFVEGQDTISGVQSGNDVSVFVSSVTLFNQWLEDHPVVEILPGGGSVLLHGVSNFTAAAGEPITTAFEGTVEYCGATPPPRGPFLSCPATTVKCQSTRHRMTINR